MEWIPSWSDGLIHALIYPIESVHWVSDSWKLYSSHESVGLDEEREKLAWCDSIHDLTPLVVNRGIGLGTIYLLLSHKLNWRTYDTELTDQSIDLRPKLAWTESSGLRPLLDWVTRRIEEPVILSWRTYYYIESTDQADLMDWVETLIIRSNQPLSQWLVEILFDPRVQVTW